MTFDREMNDIFAVQEEIASAVAGALKVKLLAAKNPGPAAKSTNADAYKAYLMGRYFRRQRNKENLERAAGYFDEAIRLDPGYAPAWAELAFTRTSQETLRYIPADEGNRKAEEAVERALALDPNLAQAHVALGSIKMSRRWDWAGANASFQRARELEPGNAEAIRGAASLANNLGRLDEAIVLGKRAIEIDPLDSVTYSNLGIVLYRAGRPEEAVAAFRKALEITPDRERTHSLIGRVYLVQSRPQEALAEMLQEKRPAFRLFGLSLAYYALGRKQESDASLAELIREFPTGYPYQIAEVYAFRGRDRQGVRMAGACLHRAGPGASRNEIGAVAEQPAKGSALCGTAEEVGAAFVNALPPADLADGGRVVPRLGLDLHSEAGLFGNLDEAFAAARADSPAWLANRARRSAGSFPGSTRWTMRR